MTKTISDHIEDIRRERAAQAEQEIWHEAAARVARDAEAERIAALNAEVGLPPDAPPAEVARRHKQWEDAFWSAFVNANTSTAVARTRAVAVELGLDPDRAEPSEIFAELRRRKAPMPCLPLATHGDKTPMPDTCSISKA